MKLSEQMRERRAALKAKLDDLNSKVEARDDKTFSDDETREFDGYVTEIRAADTRIPELEAIEANDAKHADVRAQTSDSGVQTGTAQVKDAPVYFRSHQSPSYIRDLLAHRYDSDANARDRLVRGSGQAADEQRALGNTGATGGSGGEFSPPAWFVNEWINIIRQGRVTVDLYRKMDIPTGVSSVNFPKLSTGTTVALQSSQNSALSQTDLTTSFVQAGWATVGGKQVVSQQLLDQTAVNFDQIILGDLAADYARQVGALTFLGTGNGSGTGAVVNGLTNATFGTTQTWTQGTPTAALFFSQTADMLQKFLLKRLASPTNWVMSPRRWYWLVSATDSTGRPFVVPNGPAYNQLATQDNPTAVAGIAGTLHGVPVYLDPQTPINIGGGTNQDLVYLMKADDLILMESGPKSEIFRETYADSVSVLIRLYCYIGTVLNRHSESLAVMTGTGLVAPTFPG